MKTCFKKDNNNKTALDHAKKWNNKDIVVYLESLLYPQNIQDKPVLDTNIYKSELVSRMTCPICLINEKKIISNCGHMLCNSCNNKLLDNKCAECRIPITTKNIMYYNKYLKYKNKYLALKNKL